MKYHTLLFLKFGKMLQYLSSAAVVIGALRVNCFVEQYKLCMCDQGFVGAARFYA